VFTHRALPEVPGADIRFVTGDVRSVHQDMINAARQLKLSKLEHVGQLAYLTYEVLSAGS
jgi:hypothetical protein